LTRHIELLNGKTLLILLYVRIGLTGDLFGVGDGLGHRQSLGRGKSTDEYDNSKRDERAHSIPEESLDEVRIKSLAEATFFMPRHLRQALSS
jgi:hypothetical protein